MTLAYASELTLEQYQLFESLLSPAHTTGRARSVNLMLVVQAILYVLTRLRLAIAAQNLPALLNGLLLLPQMAKATTVGNASTIISCCECA